MPDWIDEDWRSIFRARAASLGKRGRAATTAPVITPTAPPDAFGVRSGVVERTVSAPPRQIVCEGGPSLREQGRYVLSNLLCEDTAATFVDASYVSMPSVVPVEALDAIANGLLGRESPMALEELMDLVVRSIHYSNPEQLERG